MTVDAPAQAAIMELGRLRRALAQVRSCTQSVDRAARYVETEQDRGPGVSLRSLAATVASEVDALVLQVDAEIARLQTNGGGA